MNYDAWRNAPEVREKMKRLAQWLEAGTPSPVVEQLVENLLHEAWINGTGQGAAEERLISGGEADRPDRPDPAIPT